MFGDTEMVCRRTAGLQEQRAQKRFWAFFFYCPWPATTLATAIMPMAEAEGS